MMGDKMAVSGDVTLTQDGARLHPYLVALVRWCISSFWSTASVLIHRLLTAPLPPITASKPPKRPASSDHLHPEPLVECVVLRTPPEHTLDVIFVHGLYGSLGNTWKQGEWRSRFKDELQKVPLRRHTDTPQLQNTPNSTKPHKIHKSTKKSKHDEKKLRNEFKHMFKDINKMDNVNEFYEDIKRILPNENMFITEKFYNNTLLDQVEIVGNYESQANFVRDLFKNSCEGKCMNKMQSECCQSECQCQSGGYSKCRSQSGGQSECQCQSGRIQSECQCQSGKMQSDWQSECQCQSECEVGCGCVCDKCYSTCWPRDWIKEDFPGARVISINYTSDPYLWRPLWIKQIKRMRLHERAEQMTSQLLGLGVGDRPIVWVGHSKGGLFIKQIFCDAYDAHIKMTEDKGKIDDESEIILNDSLSECNDLSMDAKSDSSTDNKIVTPKQASLWSNSAGFMFYSVPHRGSPLADIKTPITARSIELLEISNNCPLLLTLQARWLGATSSSSAAVHSLVETCRTLMSVLWLRIVSVDSADPGLGGLYGVSVDHREICKPSSRKCLLYTELMHLMRSALTPK